MTARELPIVKIGDKLYYQDDFLEEFRAINNPDDKVTYKEFFKNIKTKKRYIDVSGI
jgi:hypothetical protein